MTEDEFITKAQKSISNIGWEFEESFNEKGECHLIITKGNERKAWGMFDRFYCWSEAYISITGKSLTHI